MEEVEALLGTNRWIMKKWGLFFFVNIYVYIYVREKRVGGG